MRRTLRLELLDDRLVPAILNINPTEVGVFRNGTWFLDVQNHHQIDSSNLSFAYGAPGDIPIVGHWNASPFSEVGVFRNVNGVGVFTLDTNGDHVFDAGDSVFTFGLGTDTPVAGQWDGTGQDRVGVFRNVNGVGQFILDTQGHQHYDTTSSVFNFGAGTDKPVIGDWNGSGISKVGVFRNAAGGAGQFVLDFNGTHVQTSGQPTFIYGLSSDFPVIGDWSGSSRVKVGVARDNGHGGLVWSLDYNGDQVYDTGDQVFVYGLNTDRPVVGQW